MRQSKTKPVICHTMDRISVGTYCLIALQEEKRYIGLLNNKTCSKFGGGLQPSPMSLKPTQYYLLFHSLFSNKYEYITTTFLCGYMFYVVVYHEHTLVKFNRPDLVGIWIWLSGTQMHAIWRNFGGPKWYIFDNKRVFSHNIIIIIITTTTTTTTFALAFFPYTYQQITNGIVFLAFYVPWAWFSQDIRLVIVLFIMW